MEGAQEHVEGGNKKIALLVAVLAAFLAISEMGGKSSQTHALAEHIDASNLWSFFQAKTIRQTTMRTAADAIEANYKDGGQPMPEGLKKQVETWRAKAMSAYHMFEYGSAALQLAIVLAGAAALTNVMALALAAGGLGILGVVCGALGFLAPTLLHL
jgi:hypothetical protein